MNRQNEAGFTLIELMIATIVFTVILLGVTTAMIQIGRMYYKGVITARTQQTTRNVMDDISRQIQFGGDTVQGPTTQPYAGTPNITISAYCVGNQRYTYLFGPRVSDGVAAGTYDGTTQEIRHVLWRDTLSSAGTCIPLDLRQNVPDDGNNVDNSGSELLGSNMRLKSFSISSSDQKLFNIQLSVIYGDPDLISFAPSNPPGNPDVPQSCLGIFAGSQWCAQSGLTTNVIKRLR